MKCPPLAFFLLFFLWVENAPATTGSNDRGVLLVCPPSLLEATAEWRAFRESQGWEISIVTPGHSTTNSLAIVRQAARLASPSIRVVLLIGDGEAIGSPAIHISAETIGRWGPEKNIATDRPYGDLDGDGDSDASVGRIPINDAIALRHYLQRVVQRERRPAQWSDSTVQLVAGVGGFSPLVDTAIERTAALLINRLTPSTTELTLHRAGNRPLSAEAAGLTQPSLAWVYLGHGMRNYLPSCDTRLPAPEEKTAGTPDLAVLIACYAGDFTAPGKCVAERLLLAKNGPLGVIAATRISMPYGNTVIGARLLAGLGGDADNFGALLRSATDASIGSTTKMENKEDQAGALLAEVRPLAAMLSGPDADLDAECRDHANMYCLLGDPLLSLRRPEPLPLKAPDRVIAGQTIAIEIQPAYAGKIRCVLTKNGATPLVVERHVVKGKATLPIALLSSAKPGTYRLTTILVGTNENRLAAGGAELHLSTQRLSSVPRQKQNINRLR